MKTYMMYTSTAMIDRGNATTYGRNGELKTPGMTSVLIR